MKKLKQLSLILFISVGLFSCEAEKPGEETTNQYLEGKQIFRYDIDGQTRVTDNVTVSILESNILVSATFNDDISGFQNQVFTIRLNKLATGNYISSLGNVLVDETIGITSASYKPFGQNWSYSTDNLPFNVDGNIQDLINYNFQTGSLSINLINDKAKYFSGDFEYDLYAPEKENPDNLLPPVRIRNGYFYYIKYD